MPAGRIRTRAALPVVPDAWARARYVKDVRRRAPEENLRRNEPGRPADDTARESSKEPPHRKTPATAFASRETSPARLGGGTRRRGSSTESARSATPTAACTSGSAPQADHRHGASRVRRAATSYSTPVSAPWAGRTWWARLDRTFDRCRNCRRGLCGNQPGHPIRNCRVSRRI